VFDRAGEFGLSTRFDLYKMGKERYDVHVLDETLIGCLGVFVAWVATKVMRFWTYSSGRNESLDFARSFAFVLIGLSLC
jgi:hypothetical protein